MNHGPGLLRKSYLPSRRALYPRSGLLVLRALSGAAQLDVHRLPGTRFRPLPGDELPGRTACLDARRTEWAGSVESVDRRQLRVLELAGQERLRNHRSSQGGGLTTRGTLRHLRHHQPAGLRADRRARRVRATSRSAEARGRRPRCATRREDLRQVQWCSRASPVSESGFRSGGLGRRQLLERPELLHAQRPRAALPRRHGLRVLSYRARSGESTRGPRGTQIRQSQRLCGSALHEGVGGLRPRSPRGQLRQAALDVEPTRNARHVVHRHRLPQQPGDDERHLRDSRQVGRGTFRERGGGRTRPEGPRPGFQ